MSDDYIIEKVEQPSEENKQEKVYYRSVHFGRNGLDWKIKLKIWGFILGGIAVGTVFFLFFITLFVYLFVPAVILFALWNLFSRKR